MKRILYFIALVGLLFARPLLSQGLYPPDLTPSTTPPPGTAVMPVWEVGVDRAKKTTIAGMLNHLGFSYNVLSYGADKTGVADSTTAFNSAIAAVVAAGGGTVYIPAGTYLITPASLSAVTTKGVQFVGDGPSGTRIVANANGDIFKFGNPAAPFAPCGGLFNLKIQGATTRTGWAMSVDGCDQGSILNVSMDIGGNGVVWCPTGTQCNIWKVWDLRIVTYGNATVGMQLANGNDRFIHGLNIRGADADRSGKTGLLITESYGDFFSDLDIVLQEIGVHIVPGDSDGINWLWMSDVHGDTNKNYGFLLTGSNPIRGFSCAGCWGSGNGRNWSSGGGASTASRGILINNDSVASSFHFALARARDNGGIGIEVASGAKNVSFTGGTWTTGNGAEATGTLPGFKFSNSGMEVVGIRSGNFEGTGTGSQTYGIEIGAGADNFLVSGNDVRQNVSGGINNLAGISSTKRVTANLGDSGSDSYALSSPTFITQTADSGLSAEQALGALATGILKVTTTTGVLSTAVAGDFPTLNQNTTGTAAGLSATLAVASGGTNLTSASDDAAMVGNGTTWQSKTITDCTDSGGNHLNYTQSTNTFSCGTSSSSGWADSGTTVSTVTSTDKVGIGTSSPPELLSVTSNGTAASAGLSGTLAHFWSANAANSRVLIDGFGGVPFLDFRRAETSAASPSAVQATQVIGQLAWFGYGATGYSSGGRIAIAGVANQNWTDSAQGTRLEFSATPDGSTTGVKYVTLANNGHLILSGTAPSISCTGTGTGATATAVGVDGSFRITINSGTTPSSTGTCTVTFASAYTTTNPVLVCMPVSGASAWGTWSAIQLTTESLSAPVLTWTNIAGGAATNLTGSSSYKIHCLATGI